LWGIFIHALVMKYRHYANNLPQSSFELTRICLPSAFAGYANTLVQNLETMATGSF